MWELLSHAQLPPFLPPSPSLSLPLPLSPSLPPLLPSSLYSTTLADLEAADPVQCVLFGEVMRTTLF